jgi:hypothetical protein
VCGKAVNSLNLNYFQLGLGGIKTDFTRCKNMSRRQKLECDYTTRNDNKKIKEKLEVRQFGRLGTYDKFRIAEGHENIWIAESVGGIR